VSEYHDGPLNGKKLRHVRQTRARQLVMRDHWAVVTDGIQWILQRYQGGRWRDTSFVRSTKDVLARCMREKGAAAEEIASLLADLPGQFVPDSPETDLKAGSRRFGARPGHPPFPAKKIAAAESKFLKREPQS